VAPEEDVMDSNSLRRAFTAYFVERGHVAVPSASLVPHDPTLLFTVAGMVPFKPYFLGEEVPPFRRATSIQKCMRAGGKHNDLDQIGRTTRHLTFFEMLGNFSFGDYFKETAIPLAWGLVTEVLGLDPERLWVTVHRSDDDAAQLWTELCGVPPGRIQRLDEDNWWQMGETGPCGPCSEIYVDKGEAYGAGGGPALGSDERFLEIWNLVFMQYDRHSDGSLTPLPAPCIDTGAGLERIVPILQGHESVFETDLVWPLLEEAQSLTGRRYGVDHETDVGLRIIADHARASAFLIADGIVPTNEGRGYVLRRILRRLVARAQLLGAKRPVAESMVGEVAAVMGEAYPELTRELETISALAAREEERFLATLRLGRPLLEEAIEQGRVDGELAFRLHDTYGIPIELTEELAADRGVEVDRAGFEAYMARQRERARAAGLGTEASEHPVSARVLREHGRTEFTGYDTTVDEGRLLELTDEGGVLVAYLDRTPFYPEGGGQLGDQGVMVGEGFRLTVVDTDQPLQGVIRHHIGSVEGEPVIGSLVRTEVDQARREGLRVHHTATHLLHWALRSVLGDHVKQQGSLVAPDHLRFDFTHWGPLTPEEIEAVERLVAQEVVSDAPVRTELMDREEALERGAIAFFGDRYGDVVRVVRAGAHSVELCGGTHLDRLGRIGQLRIVSESSIGANTRRVEAVVGLPALEVAHADRRLVGAIEAVLPGGRDGLPGRVAQLVERARSLESELRRERSRGLAERARELAVRRNGSGVVVARVDGLDQRALRELAVQVRGVDGVEAVVLGGEVNGVVALAAAVRPGAPWTADALLAPVAKAVGGGVGRAPEVAVSGGRRLEALDEALRAVAASVG
jgi:alanyl-tRNA synthetase